MVSACVIVGDIDRERDVHGRGRWVAGLPVSAVGRRYMDKWAEPIKLPNDVM